MEKMTEKMMPAIKANLRYQVQYAERDDLDARRMVSSALDYFDLSREYEDELVAFTERCIREWKNASLHRRHKVTLDELNAMPDEAFDFDLAEAKVRIYEWRGDFPGYEREAWLTWASDFVRNDSRDVAEDGFRGINERSDLEIYHTLRLLGHYGHKPSWED